MSDDLVHYLEFLLPTKYGLATDIAAIVLDMVPGIIEALTDVKGDVLVIELETRNSAILERSGLERTKRLRD